MPFFFVLAIVFGLLEIVDVFKKNSVNLIISLVFAFFAAGYPPFVTFFFSYFSVILWFFVGIFFIIFFLEMLGVRGKRAEGKEEVPIVLAGITILILISVGIGYIRSIQIPVIGTENLIVFIGLFLLGLIFYYAFQLGRRG